MNLEEIEKNLIKNFEIKKALKLINALDKNFSKEDLLSNIKALIKMAYLSREMCDIHFSSAYLQITRSYGDGYEASYSLALNPEISSEFSYELEEAFLKKEESKNDLLKNELEKIKELNIKEAKNNDNEFSNFTALKLEEIIRRYI